MPKINLGDIRIEEINESDFKLLAYLKKLDIRNLGRQAAINEWVIPVIIKYGKYVVVKDDRSAILGVCQILRSFSDLKTAFIHSFYIEKKYRFRGIGKLLLKEVLKILKNNNISLVELTVNPKNEAAVNLYEGSGFKKVSFKKNEYGRKVDRYLMRLEI